MPKAASSAPMPAPRRCSARPQPSLTGRSLGDLLAPESERAARDYLDRIVRGTGTSDNVLDVAARAGDDRLVPLAMTLDPHRRRPRLRDIPRHHQPQAERGRAAQRQARDAARGIGQGGIPRQGQPRNPHAAQCHDRLCRSDHGRALRPDRQRALPRIYQGHPRRRHASGLDAQRPARSVADRDRADRAQLRQRQSQRR